MTQQELDQLADAFLDVWEAQFLWLSGHMGGCVMPAMMMPYEAMVQQFFAAYADEMGA